MNPSTQKRRDEFRWRMAGSDLTPTVPDLALLDDAGAQAREMNNAGAVKITSTHPSLQHVVHTEINGVLLYWSNSSRPEDMHTKFEFELFVEELGTDGIAMPAEES